MIIEISFLKCRYVYINRLGRGCVKRPKDFLHNPFLNHKYQARFGKAVEKSLFCRVVPC